MDNNLEKSNRDKEEKTSGGVAREIADLLETVLIAVFVILMVFTYLFRPVTVDGRSMNPTFMDGDRVFMSEFFFKPSPGDVVIVDDYNGHVLDESGNVVETDGLNTRIIKRIIAVSGQTIDINFETGEVKRDGKLLDEKYIQGSTTDNLGGFTYPLTVPDGYVFVMGDNRNHSTDSRAAAVGLVPENSILGRVFCRYYPFTSFKIF